MAGRADERRTEVNRMKQTLRSQGGFTLIELLAVMAIIAVLVAIVAPAVSGTKNSSTEAQAIQDAMQVRAAAIDFFQDQNSTEVLTSELASAITPLGVKVGEDNSATYSGSNTATTTVTANQQKSSRWPEKFIVSASTSTDSIYYLEFDTGGATIETVYIVDSDNKIIDLNDLLVDYTAIDVDTLVLSSNKYLEEEPTSGDTVTDLAGTSSDPHTFLWLFKKTKSSGSSTFDNREVKVFKLESATKVGAFYTLKYVEIF